MTQHLHHHLKGLLEFLTLTAISTECMHAREIIDRLRYVGINTTHGTLYPLLNRLKKKKYLEAFTDQSDMGNMRKYYELTPEGKGRLEDLDREWEEINSTIHKIRRSPSQDR